MPRKKSWMLGLVMRTISKELHQALLAVQSKKEGDIRRYEVYQRA